MQLVDGTTTFPISERPANYVPPTPGRITAAEAANYTAPPEDCITAGSDDVCRVVEIADLAPERDIPIGVAPVSGFLANILGYKPRVEAESHSGFAFSGRSTGINTNMLLATADLAFQAHLPLGLRPEVLWQVILGQVAIAVKQDPETYRHLFTRSAGSETIVVRHDGLRMGDPWGWGDAIGMFRAPLEERVPSKIMEIAMSDSMSTSGVTEQISTLITFMEAASPFYKYEVHTLCGIPKVALYGSAEDWRLLRDKLVELANLFPGMRAYFTALFPILEKLVQAAEGAPVAKAQAGNRGWTPRLVGGDHFWTSIFKRRSESGGDRLSGWLTAFFAYTNDWENSGLHLRTDFAWDREWGGISPNMFPGSGSVVDFVWDYFGERHDMKFVGGVLANQRHSVQGTEFFTPRLGWSVVHASRAPM